MSKILFLIGSDSDFPQIKDALEILDDFGVDYEIEVTSAHRTPQRTLNIVKKAEEEGVQIIIAGAGGSAHLAGVVASHTLIPVIGVPMESSISGLDSLLSTVQMPKGVPVATMGIGKSGASNAALFAVEVLSLQDENLKQKLQKYRENLEIEVEKKSENLKKLVKGNK
ncbi:MAG: 5-(carboxyamino)imidazole ribonucleotide mutase [Acidobacteriota bacterium]